MLLFSMFRFSVRRRLFNIPTYLQGDVYTVLGVLFSYFTSCFFNFKMRKSTVLRVGTGTNLSQTFHKIKCNL